jgi:hypothetical protein
MSSQRAPKAHCRSIDFTLDSKVMRLRKATLCLRDTGVGKNSWVLFFKAFLDEFCLCVG